MTQEQAVKLYESKWYENRLPIDLASFQLFEERLCMPFGIFHEAVEKALGRSVWTHEFADPENLQKELLGDKPKPTLEEILNLIPEDKRIILVVS